MGTKPKTCKTTSKEKKPKETQKEQSERFIEAARNLSVDESGKKFESAMHSLLSSGRPDRKVASKHSAMNRKLGKNRRG